jgi:hypothetical protein
MNRARIVRVLLFTAALLAIVIPAPSWTYAQIVAPDQIIGPQPEGSAPLTEGVIVTPNDDATTKGLDQGLERPLNVPDRMMDGEETRLPLGTPDQTDAENVRESDEKAAVAF